MTGASKAGARLQIRPGKKFGAAGGPVGRRLSVASVVRQARVVRGTGAEVGQPQRVAAFRTMAVRTALLALSSLGAAGCMAVGSGADQQPVAHASGMASPSGRVSGAPVANHQVGRPGRTGHGTGVSAASSGATVGASGAAPAPAGSEAAQAGDPAPGVSPAPAVPGSVVAVPPQSGSAGGTGGGPTPGGGRTGGGSGGGGSQAPSTGGPGATGGGPSATALPAPSASSRPTPSTPPTTAPTPTASGSGPAGGSGSAARRDGSAAH
jgi:hypothetical protein